jgi:hypothetical protein
VLNSVLVASAVFWILSLAGSKHEKPPGTS